MTAFTVTKRAQRVAVACFFFVVGLSFASWASRIPDIKARLGLNEALLGGVLFALPVGSMLSMPLSGWLVARFGSKRIVTIATICYPLMLIVIGLTASVWQLVAALFGFGLLGNMCNISINTQAVGVESQYGRSIMASFHGLWSLAGFCGAAIGKLMVAADLSPFYHFCIVCAVSIVLVISVRGSAVEKDAAHPDQPIFAKPDNHLLKLGLIAFSCMACEGTMFDWSGVYFQEVVQAPKAQITLGYACFMGTMATGRFLGDRIVTAFGRQRVLQLSGIVITTGLLTAVLFPTLVMAALGFLLVGFGVSSVVPLVYSSAGKSKKFSPGVALAAVSTIGFLGFLIGPPVIGFIAHALSLRWSFTLIAVLGFGTTVLASLMRWED
ncbi:MAG: MFS transporter [Chitinophagaceae bacterium]|nr:MFS transporter [Chitinophagaceae bacterium]